jgi:hypothetical protein
MGKSLVTWDGGGAGISSGSFTGIGGSGDFSGEARAQYYISEAATFSYLQALISSGGSGSNTITFRDTGVDTSLTATRSGTGDLSDTTNSATVAAADLVSVAFTDTGSAPVYSFLAAVVSFSSGHGSFHQSQNGPIIYNVPSSTRFVPVNGVSLADGTATEADAQFKNRAYTSWESLQVYVTANARVNTSTVNNRINGANGAASISIGAGVTGMLTDNTVGDTLAAGDLLCASVVLDTGVENLRITSFGATFKNSSLPKCDVVTQTIGGVARTASATESYATYAGGIRVRTQTDSAIPAPYAFKLSNPRMYLSANTYTVNASYKIYKNATASITVTLTAATTGWFEDTTNTIDYAVGDTFYYGLVDGTSGSARATAAAVTIEEITSFSVTANTGSYAVTGSNANLLYGRKLIANTGFYAVTGFNANLLYGRKFSAETGVYAITGFDANLFYNRKLISDTGSYAITGFAATLTKTTAGGYSINAESGTYALTGFSANLLTTRLLLAAPGSYAVTGFNATLTQGGIVPIVIEDTHDGDRVRKRFEKERRDRDRRKKQIIEAYEYLIEGKVPAAQEIIEQFVESEEKPGTVAIEQQYINFDKFLNDLNAVERLWQLYLAMDDEDVLALL